MWVAVPVLVAVGLAGLGIWTIRTSRGEVSRAVGVLVIAAGILVAGYALMVGYSLPIDPSGEQDGRTHSVEIVETVEVHPPPGR